MINTPDITIKLTDEENARIEKTKGVLLNLESEIAIANRNLKAIKLDSERATKENIYQNELLGEISSKTETKQKELDDLKTIFLEISYKLDDLNKEIKEKTTVFNLKEVELKEREEELVKSEKDLNDKSETIILAEERVRGEQLVFNQKVATLKEVIKNI